MTDDVMNELKTLRSRLEDLKTRRKDNSRITEEELLDDSSGSSQKSDSDLGQAKAENKGIKEKHQIEKSSKDIQHKKHYSLSDDSLTSSENDSEGKAKPAILKSDSTSEEDEKSDKSRNDRGELLAMRQIYSQTERMLSVSQVPGRLAQALLSSTERFDQTQIYSNRPSAYDKMETDIVHIRKHLEKLKSRTGKVEKKGEESYRRASRDLSESHSESHSILPEFYSQAIRKPQSKEDTGDFHKPQETYGATSVYNRNQVDDKAIEGLQGAKETQLREELFSDDEDDDDLVLPEYLTDEEKLKQRIEVLNREKVSLKMKATILEDRLKRQQRGEIKKTRLMDFRSVCKDDFRNWMKEEGQKNKQLIKAYYKNK